MTKAGVEFLNYEDIVRPSSPEEEAKQQQDEVLLYIPGLDFSGVSGAGQFPIIAQDFELWRCRVASSDRTPFASLADTVTDFVEGLIIEEGKKVTLLGESFGGILALGVAQRLQERLSAFPAQDSGDAAGSVGVGGLRGVV